jgi:riboflavin kinase/FMN adenylyltransferase
LDEFTDVKNPVVTIGIFDGVHLGHQKILSRLIDSARELNGEAVLLSFFPHPRTVLQPEKGDLRLINTLDEKISLLNSLGLQNIIIHPFDKAFSEIESADFVKIILVDKLKVKKLIIGYDHHFGKGRTGSFELLKSESLKYKFELEEIPAQDIQDVNISSSKIRNALFEGDVELANEFLGYPYFMRGTVIKGDQIGRKINFPTANIYIEEKYKLIPREGVYAVKVKVADSWFAGMLNIGHRPTFPGKDFSIEVHILDFNEEIYGKTIQINLLKRIRDEIKFEDIDSLQNQLIKDRTTVKSLLT